MSQQQSPWLESAYGWNFGEGGWNTGMDENLLKFSFMFDRNIDGVVASLPAAVNGQAHYLTTDNRVYFAVGTTYFSTPVPKWCTLKLRSSGQYHQFNGTNLVQVDTPIQTDTRLDAVEVTVASLGTSAFESIEFFATQADLDVAEAQAAAHTDILRQNLADPTIGAGIVAFDADESYPVNTTGSALKELIVGDSPIADYAELAVLTGEAGEVVSVRGCTFVWDGGWVSTNGINPVIFGADPAGVVSASAAIQDAADYCVANSVPLWSAPDEVFLLDAQVDLRFVPGVNLQGPLETETDDFIPVLAGYSSLNRAEWVVNIRKITWRNQPGSGVTLANLPDNPLLRIVGCKNTNFELGNIDYIQLYADSDDPTTDSVSYAVFHVQQCEKLELTTNPVPAGTTVQWINENKFFGGRIRRIYLSGTYGHNHNHWYSPTMETNGLIDFQVGTSNRVMNCRLEGGGITLNAETGTSANVVTRSWVNVPRDSITAVGTGVTVTDAGVGNVFVNDMHAWFDRVVMFGLSFGQPLAAAVNQQGVTSTNLTKNGLFWNLVTGNTLFESALIPCLAGMGFDIQSDQSLWRGEIFFYDAAGAQITAASDPLLLSSSSYTWSGASNSYVRSSNFADIPSPPMVLTGVGFVKLILRSGATTTGVDFKGVQVVGMFGSGARHASMAAAQPKWL